MTALSWLFLGQVPYQEAWALQRQRRQQRIAGEIEDQLLLLEHPPTITLGRLRGEESLQASTEALAARGVEVIRSDRGGDATLHAPGQLVGYMIVDIAARGLALPAFVERTATAFVALLQTYDIDAHYDPQYPGVWVQNDKIVAFGFHLLQGVTMHGFAFNVHTDLSLFDLIIPCGLRQKGVTSLAKLAPTSVPTCQEIAPTVAKYISQVLAP